MSRPASLLAAGGPAGALNRRCTAYQHLSVRYRGAIAPAGPGGASGTRHPAQRGGARQKAAEPGSPRSRFQMDAKKEAERQRELLLAVLSAQPTSRDAKSFLKAFGGANGAPKLREIEQREANLASIGSRRHENLALVYLRSGLSDRELESFASSIVHLQKLGLMPIVMLQDSELLPGQPPPPGTGMAQRMFEEVVRVAGMVDAAGGRALPIYEGVFTLDGPGSWGVVGALEEAGSEETGISADVKPILHALRYEQIPVITPLAYAHTHHVPIATTSAMIQVSRALQKEGSAGSVSPLKVILINKRGGIHTAKGPLSMVNLREDFEDIRASLAEASASGDAAVASNARQELNDLWTVKQTLESLPPSTSAILASASVSAAAISNLITDKPTFSSSLDEPPDTFYVGGAVMDTENAPTVVRNGLKVTVHRSLDDLDLERLRALLEASFGRTLEAETFWARLRSCLDTVILAGDYDGASIMTRESWPGTDGLIYLDKFSASPQSQGTGVADILWRRMGREYDLWFWRSRTVNPVNKWYAPRALDLTARR
ncbi:hypothetical protein DFJ74DRAFT_212231 [Hyaloraphidium curvatum]|nr:hypothetical protein DFJ74DRAFT_212231 [Hyaloraphidium curvatum]